MAGNDGLHTRILPEGVGVSWIKLDDRMPEHPKVVGLSDRAFRAHIEALCYCAGTLTDGVISTAIAKKRGWLRSAEALEGAGLWETHDDGWYIHDFLEHQRSRENAQRLSEERSRAGKRGASVRANAKQIAEDLLKQTASRSEEMRSEEKRSDPPNPTDSVPKKSRAKAVRAFTDEDRMRMHAKYSPVASVEAIDLQIDLALAHDAARKSTRHDLYVQNWLNRAFGLDSSGQRTTAGGAGAQVRGGYGQNRGASGVARMGSQRREPIPIDLPPGQTNGAVQPRVVAQVPGAQSGGGYGGRTAASGVAW